MLVYKEGHQNKNESYEQLDPYVYYNVVTLFMLLVLVINSFRFILIVQHHVWVTFLLLLFTLVVVLVRLIVTTWVRLSILTVYFITFLPVILPSPINSIHVNILVILVIDAFNVNHYPKSH